jgi:hypothetical protein
VAALPSVADLRVCPMRKGRYKSRVSHGCALTYAATTMFSSVGLCLLLKVHESE